MQWHELETPALLLDKDVMLRNMARMREHLQALGVSFRPHLKTCKCMDVARLCMDSAQGPATVSTLAEADYFAGQGVKDMLYAVGIAPNKLAHAARLRRAGVELKVVVDSVAAAQMLAQYGRDNTVRFDVLVEIDADGHRSGLVPGDKTILDVAAALSTEYTTLLGVMTHAGNAYACRSVQAIRDLALQERDSVVTVAQALRAAGYACPVVSVGSTPTALLSDNWDGVTEVRAGVYMFFDLVMAGLGVCKVEDVALSVLATVIGHQKAKGWIIVDAGWMALSRDRGTAKHAQDQGYGLVCDVHGQPLGELIVVDANQEHGILARRDGGTPLDLPLGTQVRILPNHACATAAAYGSYQVLEGGNLSTQWTRCNGWG